VGELFLSECQQDTPGTKRNRWQEESWKYIMHP